VKFAWLAAGAAFCVLLGLLIRLLPMEYIFTDSGVQLSSVDAYYYQICTDQNITIYQSSISDKSSTASISANMWPATYPPIFSTILSTISQFTGIDTKTVAAVLPVIIFLFCIPVFGYISWLLFNNKMITALAVGLYCIMPGELLFRTMLGNGEQHCIEILLMLLCIMAILMIQKSKSAAEAITALILWVLVSWVYLQIWLGAIIIMVILAVYLLLYYFIHAPNNILRITIPIAVTMVVVIAIVLKGELLFYMFGIDYLSLYNEGMPLFFTQGRFDLATPWNYFGITLYFAIIG
jgi:asparagine N-glycosylation enzyme membrane subunit Stt3